MKSFYEKNKKFIFGVGALIIIIILLIVAIPNGEKEISTKQNTSLNQTKVQTTSTETKNTATVDKIVYSESKLCENYVFSQGEELLIEGVKVKIVKIGPTSVRISINNEDAIISEGSFVFKQNIRVELLTKKLLYYAENDEDNAVELRIGCNKDEDPTDKHILETIGTMGVNICEDLIASCQKEFGLE